MTYLAMSSRRSVPKAARKIRALRKAPRWRVRPAQAEDDRDSSQQRCQHTAHETVVDMNTAIVIALIALAGSVFSTIVTVFGAPALQARHDAKKAGYASFIDQRPTMQEWLQ